MPATFISLPTETILGIFCLLQAVDIVRLSRVSRSFYRIVSSFTSIRLQIECEKTFTRQLFKPIVSTDKILEFLEARERNWLNLKFTGTVSIKIPFMKRPWPTEEVYLSAGYLIVRVFSMALHYIKLPNCLHNVDNDGPGYPKWERLYLGDNSIYCHLELEEHDLILIYTLERITDPVTLEVKKEIQLHLRQFSTNQDHPDAKRPLLWRMAIPLEMNRSDFWLRLFKPDIQVVGNILIMSIFGIERKDLSSTLIYDWKEGILLKNIMFDNNIYTSFIMVTPDLLLMPNQPHNTLDLVSIAKVTNGKRTVTLIKKLALPDIRKDVLLVTIIFRHSALIGKGNLSKARGIQNAIEAGGHGLQSVNDDSIIIIDLEYEYPDPEGCKDSSIMADYSIVVHRSAIRDLAESSAGLLNVSNIRKWKTCGPSRAIPWEKWGPPISRMERDMTKTFYGMKNMCMGQRHIVSFSKIPDRNKKRLVSVRDYNRYNIRDLMARGQAVGSSYVCVLDTLTVRHPEVFLNVVQSSLPYIMSMALAPQPYVDVLMDEDRIVAVSPEDNYHVMDILYLSPDDEVLCKSPEISKSD